MIRSKLTLAVTVLAAISLPLGVAQAANTNGNNNAERAQAQAPRSDSNAGEREICVRERLTGSHQTRRICKTEREWQNDGGVPGRDD